ncbi:MAG: glycyl-radical enzyme activating protein [Candidatus Heimdallarchaeota archaeon]
MGQKGIIFDIKKYAVHDGPGIRTTIFFKGCPMDCWWCHNPESHKIEPETITRKIVTSSSTKACHERKEVIGREVTTEEVMKEIEKDMVFYEESDGGVTFSGGEPLSQPEFLIDLLQKCKKRGIHTTLDTSGCASKKELLNIVGLVDLFLYDLKIVDDEKHLHYTGESNKQILGNLKTLAEKGEKIIIRIPIIPTVNDDQESIDQFGKLLSTIDILRVELLPFHKIGEEKYPQLNKVNRMKDIQKPTKENIEVIKESLEKFGLKVKVEE